MIERAALLSIHTSPLARPGAGDAGGMNVYVDAVARALAGRGVGVDVFTGRTDNGHSGEIEVCPGYRVIHIESAGDDRGERVSRYAEGVAKWTAGHGLVYDVLHSHYWLAAWAGMILSDVLAAPMAISFHTLGRVRDVGAGEPPQPLVRIATEREVISHAGCVVASTAGEASDLIDHYGARPERVCVIPPGVDHALFGPGDEQAARRTLGLGAGLLALVAGRVQPLKGIDVAIATAGMIPDLKLVVVGGPSGPAGDGEFARLHTLAEQVAPGRVVFMGAVPHADMPAFYRAADVLLAPSRAESFGLAVVEAQACGTPVVASRLGGLRVSVADGYSGILVDDGDAATWAQAVMKVLGDRAQSPAAGAIVHASRFSWEATASRLLELYDSLR